MTQHIAISQLCHQPLLSQHHGLDVDSEEGIRAGLMWAPFTADLVMLLTDVPSASNRAPYTALSLEETSKPLGSNNTHWEMPKSPVETITGPSCDVGLTLAGFAFHLLVRC